MLSEYLSEWVIETRSLPMGLSYIVGERSHGHKDQMYEDQTHNQLAIWGGFMKEVALSWALKKGDWGTDAWHSRQREELNGAQTFNHWCIWGGERSINMPR